MSMIQPSSYYARPESGVWDYDYRRSTTYSQASTKPKRRSCHDWIFSSATNVHVALDRTSFTTYTPFKSYVLTVGEQKQVSVKGIGTVDLKIRRQPGSKESHIISLDKVLHIPSWLCNILSDIYFTPPTAFEHKWDEFGVKFCAKTSDGSQPWGFTENFCGLDKIVLSRNLQGRSPMLDDPEREVFAVNVSWPQSQRDKWNAILAKSEKKEAQLHEARMLRKQKSAEELMLAKDIKSGLSDMTTMTQGLRAASLDIRIDHRPELAELSTNRQMPLHEPQLRKSSLKGVSHIRGSFREIL